MLGLISRFFLFFGWLVTLHEDLMVNGKIDTGKRSWRLVMFRPRRKSRAFREHEDITSTERA